MLSKERVLVVAQWVGLNCKGVHMAMSRPVNKEIIRKLKEKREREEIERNTKKYSDVIKENKKTYTQTNPTLTQFGLGSERSYVINTCIIHIQLVNLERPGTYTKEYKMLLVSNGLPSVNASSDLPSEEPFGA